MKKQFLLIIRSILKILEIGFKGMEKAKSKRTIKNKKVVSSNTQKQNKDQFISFTELVGRK